MITLGNKYLYLNNIKEVYVGQNKVLGFDTTLNYNSTDYRVVNSGVFEDARDLCSFAPNSSVKFNAVCSRLNIGLTTYDAHEVVNGTIHILIKDFNSNNVLYTYTITVENARTTSPYSRTFKCELKDKNNTILASGTWTTSPTLTSVGNINYDFDAKQLSFPILEQRSGDAGGFLSTFKIDTPYKGYKIEVLQPLTDRTIKWFVLGTVTVQN